MEKSTFKEALPFTFVNRWDVMKPDGGSAMIRPHSRSNDGSFKPFECGFAMNRIVLDELISQLLLAAKAAGSSISNSSRIKIQVDPSSNFIQLVFTSPSGAETAMLLDAGAAIRLSQDLATAAGHIRP